MLYTKDTVPNYFDENIAFYCKKNNVKQKELAKDICISYSALLKYKRTPGIMPLYVLTNLCSYFNCTRNDLLDKHTFTLEKDYQTMKGR